MSHPTLSFVLMDAPLESARTTTAFRLLTIAAQRGYHLRVFAYEGAVMLGFARQQPHPNAVHGHSVEEENHFLPRTAVAALADEAKWHGGSLDWVNCGLCVDERGAGDAIAGLRRGSPTDFWQQAREAHNTLVIATRE
jgi:tRNA 2-thiouridine synthesizing protein D